MALKAMFIQMKKRDPLMFCMPCCVVSVLKKSKIAKTAVKIVAINFTYEVCGNLKRFKKFLLARRLNW